jgi:hypothetical protein
MDGKKYLVAPRGRTQWVRNAETAGQITLKKGRYRKVFRLRPLARSDKPVILKAYLDRFHREVQRYFPVQAGSEVGEFIPLADKYPAFQIIAAD